MSFIGYVYKITGACGLVYIGSTIDIENRKNRHNGKNNCCSSKLLKKPLQFDIIDTREYNLLRTLHLVEQFYLDNTNTINQKRAYTNERSLGYLLRKHQHYINNKEKYKQNYINNKEKIKQYKLNNKEENKEKSKAYYQKNREKRLEQNKVEIICECGCLIRKVNKSIHIKSKKHIKLMNLL